jgi:ABC-type oligopeptide transport system substrate-binding subunit
VNADNTQFTFYLRGHSAPRGIALPNTDTLRKAYETGEIDEDFARGHSAPPDDIPARWSDGRVITAHDFVYSWRRVVDPATAADYASLLYYIKNAEEINSGKARPEDLAVRALDDFTFQVDMRAPTAFFVNMQSHHVFYPVPRQAIEAAIARGVESSWTQPQHIVVSGAFTMKEWRPYDKILLVKNPNYYEADLVALQQITVLPINDNTTSVNIYKAGDTDAMSANAIPQPFIPVLKRDKRDFYITPSLGSYFYLINTKKPPFDNVILRYALNMATDKAAITEFLAAGQTPALNLVPPIEGYDTPASLNLTTAGKSYDVLSYDPENARELLARAGYPGGIGRDGHRLTVEIMFNTLESHRQIAEIVQQQWRKNLNINVELVNQEWKVYLETLDNLHYNGVARRGWIGDYVDPNTFLDLFVTGSVNNGSGWTDPKYDAMLKEANSTVDPADRMSKLGECEQYLLRHMPFVPIYIYSWFYLRKPYVRGVAPTLLDQHPFKYMWIDTEWTPGNEREEVVRAGKTPALTGDR